MTKKGYQYIRLNLKISIITLIIFCSYISYSFSQDTHKIDSIITLAEKEKSDSIKELLYSQVAEEYYFNFPDSAIKYCNIGLGYCKNLNNISGQAYFHTFLGVIFKNVAKYDSAVSHFNQSIELNKKDTFERGVAGNLNNLGQVLLLKGEYDKALNSYYSSLEIFEKYNDTLNIGELHSNIGALLVKINELDAAEEQFRLSRIQYKLAKVKLQEAWVMYDLGNIKMKKGLLDTAIVYFQESAKVWESFDRIKGYYNCMLRIGEIMIKQKKYDKAEELFFTSKQNFNKIKDSQGVSESLMLLGRVQYLQGKFSNAIENLSMSLELSDSLESEQIKMDTYFDLYNCYKKLNKTDKALLFHEKYQALKDTIFSREKNKELAEYQTKLNLFNKEVIIKQLEDSTQKQQLKTQLISQENKQKQKSIYFLILGIIIILVFLYMLYRRNKTNSILNKELNLSLKEREVLIREIHHRVKNNLQIISSLLNLQSEKTVEPDSREILRISQSRIEAMSMIHENLYKSTKLSEINFKAYVENLCKYIETSFSLPEKEIQLNCSIEPIQVEIDKLVPCGLIINELVTNSVKHAFDKQYKKSIDISCIFTGNVVKIEISDNGKGLPDGFDLKKSNSLGLRLASGLSKQLNSELLLENRNGLKATFEFNNKKNDDRHS